MKVDGCKVCKRNSLNILDFLFSLTVARLEMKVGGLRPEWKFVRAILRQDETSPRTDFFEAATAIYKVFSGYQVREVAK